MKGEVSMDGITVEQFLNAMKDVHNKMDTGFSHIADKIDELRKEASKRQTDCDRRLRNVETEILIKKKINGFKAKEDKGKVAFWKYIIGSSIVVIITGMLVVLWKLFVSHIDIIKLW